VQEKTSINYHLQNSAYVVDLSCLAFSRVKQFCVTPANGSVKSTGVNYNCVCTHKIKVGL